jgi:hypothetical protein
MGIGVGGGGTVRVIVDGAAVIVDGAAVTVLVLVMTLVDGADDGLAPQPASASPIDTAARTRVVDMLVPPILRTEQLDLQSCGQ